MILRRAFACVRLFTQIVLCCACVRAAIVYLPVSSRFDLDYELNSLEFRNCTNEVQPAFCCVHFVDSLVPGS